jgi:hypothetical protein
VFDNSSLTAFNTMFTSLDGAPPADMIIIDVMGPAGLDANIIFAKAFRSLVFPLDFLQVASLGLLLPSTIRAGLLSSVSVCPPIETLPGLQAAAVVFKALLKVLQRWSFSHILAYPYTSRVIRVRPASDSCGSVPLVCPRWKHWSVHCARNIHQ